MSITILNENIGFGQFSNVNQVRTLNEPGFKNGEYAEKIIKETIIDKINVQAEINRWNSYFNAVGLQIYSHAVAKSDKNIIYTPWFEGSKPSDDEIKSAVTKMYKAGYLMADPNPDNFKKLPDGSVIPIDFGEIYHANDNNIPENSIGLIHNAALYSPYLDANTRNEYKLFRNDFIREDTYIPQARISTNDDFLLNTPPKLFHKSLTVKIAKSTFEKDG